jgi:hypothetical protein
MKLIYLKTISLLSFFLFCANLYSQSSDSLTLQKVSNWFYSEYKSFSYGKVYNCVFYFAKKKDGWYAINNGNKMANVPYAIFKVWDKKSHKFLKTLDLYNYIDRSYLNSNIKYKRLYDIKPCDSMILDRPNASLYDQLPYYGYEKWYDDVIQDYENDSIPNNYYLAKSYEVKSRDYVQLRNAYNYLDYRRDSIIIDYDFNNKSFNTIILLNTKATFYFSQLIALCNNSSQKREYEKDLFILNMHNWFLLKLAKKNTEAQSIIDKLTLPANLLRNEQKWKQYYNSRAIAICPNDNAFYIFSYMFEKGLLPKNFILINSVYLNTSMYSNYLKGVYPILKRPFSSIRFWDKEISYSKEKVIYKSKMQIGKLIKLINKSSKANFDRAVFLDKKIETVYLEKRNFSVRGNSFVFNELIAVYLLNYFSNYKILFSHTGYLFIERHDIFEEGYGVGLSVLKD